MADKTGYPQIPGRVWWGVRDLLNRSPNMKFDDGNLAATLDVQPAAARQYLSEMKRIGLLGDEGGATELGKKWRLDDGYEGVVEQLLEASYPAGLVSIAPPGSADRATVEKWFVNDGLGSGTAKNKAGTYVMIANDRPGEAKVRAPSSASAKRDDRAAPKQTKAPTPRRKEAPPPGEKQAPATMPLNINVQIHISAEATGDQIESIFSSMRKHLYDHRSNPAD
jgi:hypothetical protein